MRITTIIAIVRSGRAAVIAAFSFFLTLLPEEGKCANNSFLVPQNGVQFLTADSWLQDGKLIRLYGVQSCLRGKTYTDQTGSSRDCGVVTATLLAAFVRDTKPLCRSVAGVAATKPGEEQTILVVCAARIKNKTVDLGGLLITQGFAFAALANDGKPVYMPYYVQESVAQQSKRGMWAFDNVPHPSKELLPRNR
ncbi:thermonuclease family protein [Agrobacterium tumefaciens]|nr:thermonuclease family protein [Agrobacterium tumefaciens]